MPVTSNEALASGQVSAICAVFAVGLTVAVSASASPTFVNVSVTVWVGAAGGPATGGGGAAGGGGSSVTNGVASVSVPPGDSVTVVVATPGCRVARTLSEAVTVRRCSLNSTVQEKRPP